ncbi:MAG: UbiA family prenyltransferase [Flavobacteriaceae bacterium]|nr:UbiA family prenyltransferase [Flavobacteriaceae bacterium]
MKSVIICDMEGIIENLNKDAEKLFGYTNSELIGKKRVSIFSEGEIVLQNVLIWLKKANEEGSYETKTKFIKKDGTVFSAKIKVTPNFSNGKNNPQTGYCGITELIEEKVSIPISFSTKIIKGVAITRAGFGSASILPVLAVASYFAGKGDYLYSTTSLLLTLAGILTLQLFSNLYNDYFDVKDGTDGLNEEYFNVGLNDKFLQGAQISGGSRAIELGLTTLKKTKSLGRIMLGISFFSVILILVLSYYNTESVENLKSISIIALLGGFFGYFYTAPPLRLVSRNGLGELTIFLAFGPLLTLGTGYAISNETITYLSNEFINLFLLGVPVGLLTTNILFINQFPDYKSDKLAAKTNLVVLFGKKASRWIYLLFLIATFSFMYFFADILNKNILYFSYTVYYVSNGLLFLIGMLIFKHIFKNYNSRALIKSNINTIYFQMIFTIIYILLLNPFYTNF